MIRKALVFLGLAALCSLASAAATYSFSYTGLPGYADTFGSGTFTTSSAGLVQTLAGSYSDPTDTVEGVSPVPIVGVQPLGSLDHFTFDNLYSAGFDNAGLVFAGLRVPASAFFPAEIGYVNLYSDTVSGVFGYYVDEYFPPDFGLPGFDNVAAVDLSVSLLSSAPAVPEPSEWAMYGAGLVAVGMMFRRKVIRSQ